MIFFYIFLTARLPHCCFDWYEYPPSGEFLDAMVYQTLSHCHFRSIVQSQRDFRPTYYTTFCYLYMDVKY